MTPDTLFKAAFWLVLGPAPALSDTAKPLGGVIPGLPALHSLPPLQS